MSNSKLVSVKVMSPNHSGKRTHKIDSVAIHYMYGNLSAKACGGVFKPESRRASSNYGIGPDGDIGLYVDERNRAWTTSSGAVDNRAVTIEVSNVSNSTGKPSSKAYEALLNLLVDICRRNGIKHLKWKNSKSLATSFKVSQQNIFIHKWFSSTSCPGPWLHSHMGDIAKEVNRRIDNKTPIKGMPKGASVDVADTEGDEEPTVELTVNWEAINPYIVAINRYTKKFDPTVLKDKKVIGCIIQAGEYLNKTRVVNPTFRSPVVYDQVKLCIENNLDFGYWLTSRVKSAAEVDKELYELSFIVRKYPPTLGVWIDIGFDNGNKVNDIIFAQYEKGLVRLGMSDKMGIHCTRKFLSRFSWDKFQDKWWLWLDDPVKKVNEFEKLLDPKFFDTDNKSGPVIGKDKEITPIFTLAGNISSGDSDDADISVTGKGKKTVKIPKWLKHYIMANLGVGDYSSRGLGYMPGTVQKWWRAAGSKHSGGIATIHGAYLVAMTDKFGNDGDLMKVVLKNGKSFWVIKCDTKGADKGSSRSAAYGHVLDGIVDVLEWYGDMSQSTLRSTLKRKGYLNKRVSYVVNYGKYSKSKIKKKT